MIYKIHKIIPDYLKACKIGKLEIVLITCGDYMENVISIIKLASEQ